MQLSTRSALIFISGGLVGAVLAVPAIADAATTQSPNSGRPTADAAPGAPKPQPNESGTRGGPPMTSSPQMTGMAEHCKQVMMTPQMQKTHHQMMSQQMGQPMMGNSMTGGGNHGAPTGIPMS